MIGKTISHYKILEELGEGGMGVVYKAKDTKLDRLVALKFLPPELTEDPAAKARFIQEAKAASTLDHTNICTIYEIGETKEGHLFIVMAYCSGETLKQRLEAGPLSVEESINIALQVAEGLARAHPGGVVHRDIKPSNIVLTEIGDAKIVDFGLAKLAGAEKITSTGTTLGTIAYMSPEQARGEEVDQRTDIWSLGVAIYEMLTGKLPFEGEHQGAVINSILNQEPTPIGRLRSGVPAELERIVTKTVAKDPGKRYQGAGELEKDLRVLRRSLLLMTSEVKASPSRAPSWMIPLLAACAAALAIVVIALVVIFWPKGGAKTADIADEESADKTEPVALDKRTKPAIAEQERPSIAVLAFENMSPDPDQEYFCDGIAEEIINKLAKVEGLKVIARTSSFQFKDEKIDIAKIGKQLDVQTVLEGSVRKSGNSLRITAQLIKVSDRSHIWTDSYEEELKDIFIVQDKISLAIVDNLKVKLLGEERANLLKRHTDDLEAHNLYLRGLFFWNRRTGTDLVTAIGFFDQAIKNDPNYALAHVGLADCYNLQSLYSDIPPHETFPKAKAAAKRALELDYTLAEAHTSLAYVLYRYDWDFAAAEQEFKTALKLNQNYAIGHSWYGEFLVVTGRFAEGISEMKRALKLDPVSMISNTILGWGLLNAGNSDQALAQLQKTLEMDPDFAPAHNVLAVALRQTGRYNKATSEHQRAIELSGRVAQVLSRLAVTHAKAGRRDSAINILEELEDRSEQQYVSPFWIATIYDGIGETDKALECLEKAYDERFEFMTHLKLLVIDFSNVIRSDPRFVDLLRRVGLGK